MHRIQRTIGLTAVLVAILIVAGCVAIPTTVPAPAATPGGPALLWQRDGGIAGFCDRLTITAAGEAVAESCKTAGAIGRATLDPEQLQRLQQWIGELSAFVVRQSDPATADAMTIVVTFHGTGDRQPTKDEQTGIAQYAASIFAWVANQQAEPAPTTVPPASDQDAATRAATRAAVDAASTRLGVDPAGVRLVSVTAEQWPDSCLGYAAPDEICLQVVTPGFRVIVESGVQRLELHTNANGSVVRVAANEASGALGLRCASEFDSHPLHAPDGAQNVRLTLSASELTDLLSQMGITSLCIPPELGAPFVNVDWSAESLPGTRGRMISLGFEALYEGAGWSNGYVLYSTCGFSTGSEYDVFATEQDRDDLRRGMMENPIEVGGARGFVRYQPSLCYGDCTLFKATVFPFDDHYIAVVLPVETVGADEDWPAVAARIETEGIPAEVQPVANAFEIVTQSLRFTGRIPWADAEQLVLSGQASGIMQTHALEVTLTLADDRRVTTIEPAIDEIFHVVDACGQACAGMSLATE